MSRASTRKANCDELRPEYDLAPLLARGVRAKYAADYRRGTNLVLLDPDVAEAFADDRAVNEVLRLALQMASVPRRRRRRQAPVSRQH